MAQVDGSLEVNASGDYIRRTTDLPSTAAITLAGWIKWTSLPPGDPFSILALNGNWWIAAWCTASSLVHGNSANGSGTSIGFLPTQDVWYYVALTAAGSGSTDQTLRIWNASGTLLDSDASVGVGNITPTSFDIGNDGGNSVHVGKFSYMRIWSAALSQAELEAEMFSRTPVRTANIDSALNNADGTDESGNGRHWTLNSITASGDYPDVFDAEGDGHQPIPVPQPLPGAAGVFKRFAARSVP